MLSWALRCVAGCILALLFSTSILAAGSPSGTIFRADFGQTEDTDNNGWPDGWQRRVDRDHPQFVKMQIAMQSNLAPDEVKSIRRTLTQWSLAWQQGKLPGDIIPESAPRWVDALLENTLANRCFEIRNDGRAAQVDSPSFPINSRNSYRISGEWMAEILDPYTVSIRLIWLDAMETIVGEIEMETAMTSFDWHRVRIDETTAIPEMARFAKIRVTAKPNGPRSLRTLIRLDRLRVERIPKIEIEVMHATGIIAVGEEVRVECHLKEIDPTSCRIELQAINQDDVVTWRDANTRASYVDALSERATASWTLRPPEPGYYRLVARVENERIAGLLKETSIAVLDKETSERSLPNARIGWCLPQLGKSLDLNQVPFVANATHAGAFKFSIWLAEDRKAYQQSLGSLVEKLSIKGIQSVGIIDPPSPEKQLLFPEGNGAKIGSLLDYPKVWQPLLEPVWRNTSLFLTHYQIGWDGDASIEEHNRWQENVQTLLKHLRTTGGEGRIAVPWKVLSPPPPKPLEGAQPSVARHVFHSDPALTSQELENFSLRPDIDPRNHWLSLKPLPRSDYSLSDRVRDLSERMMIIHRHQWGTAWISDPHHPDAGIFASDSRPRELFLPLCNLTKAMNRASDVARVLLDEQLDCYLFRTPHSDQLLILPKKPAEIGLFLGQDCSAMDVWGRSVPMRNQYVHGVMTRFLKVDRWPVIVSNVDRILVQWQQDITIENPTIENRVGLSEPVRVRMSSPSHQASRGKLELVAPTLLADEKSDVAIDLPGHKPSTVSVPMKLRFDASQNMEPVDIVVSLDDTPPRQFIVRRQLLVGLKDFQIESRIAMAPNGSAILDLELTNQGLEIANFDCTLVIPNRRREKFQWINIQERSTRQIVLPQGKDLRGQTLLLRCEEIGSGRVINHRIVVD